MCNVTVLFFNLAFRFFFFTETLSESKNDLMPKGFLEGSWIIYLKIKSIASNVPFKHYFNKEKAIYVPHSILTVERGN